MRQTILEFRWLLSCSTRMRESKSKHWMDAELSHMDAGKQVEALD